ncbi:DNA/RNA helicase, superfamily II [Rhizobium leguminosarum bv. trifolii WSM2297]|uniref:DNA/RNA helicase, superfamily II n=1 Tax=Rhizobium leguminosarum bv. trifolii WSM2297 TaxID=754762 RepID=J0CKW3_RHILT|nr:DEAD/DEAH box helicase family protein [Rhizobium leguminosarum]EJC80180.1 DNA/RNA helicase, superfamily II [Rhizobium leguminosarum bv. trifolii WSM2297]
MDSLFKEDLEIALPAQYEIAGKIHGATLRQLRYKGRRERFMANEFSDKRLRGVFLRSIDDTRKIAVIPRKTNADLGEVEVLRHPAAETVGELRRDDQPGSWVFPLATKPEALSAEEFAPVLGEVRGSWRDAFTFREERLVGDVVTQTGLRKPQIGAIHATLGHWTASSAPATVVMPTGTGKTETMLALLVVAQPERLLVVVPSDALRTQISDKFLSLGVLKDSGCLAADARLPVVAVMDSIPKSPTEVDDIFLRANLIVTTMDAAAQADPAVQIRMAELTSHLFVDEAHHIGARTWREFKGQFTNSLILQFTATPYRTDGRRVDGKFIYVYPLAKAYAEGYFKKIRFEAVYGLNREDADERIIDRVKATLLRDKAAGHDHLVMARCRTIDIAIDVHRLYLQRAGAFNPVVVHSRMSKTTRDDALKRLRSGQSKIVVCVDMLGEGFDLPDLKIAALHDKHKSEAITVQFVGRFTRTRTDLGDATIIANVVAPGMRDSLRALYAEDADWNFILEGLGTRNTKREERRQEVFEGFDEPPTDFPLDSLTPRLSAVVYETSCERWDPSLILDAYPPGTIVDGPSINQAERVAVFVRREEEKLKWTSQRQPVNTAYHLYACHWDDERQLLFITSSNLSDLHTKLAETIAGPSPKRIRGEQIFRVLDGYKRLMLSQLGLSEAVRKPIRYSQFMGSDIAPMLFDDPANRGRMKTNIFGQGYNHRGKSTMGCSIKGKIWSYESVHGFSGWIDWCREVGMKLLDTSITTNGIVRRLVLPTRQQQMPDKHATAVNWPEAVLHSQDDKIDIVIDGKSIPIYDCDIRIAAQAPGSDIVLRVGNDTSFADLVMTIDKAGAHYSGAGNAGVRIGKKTKPLVDWFKEDPPHIYYADGDMLLDFELLKLPDDHVPAFDPDRLIAMDWTGTNIRVESQGASKDPSSIQRRVIEDLLANHSYDVIFDDDGSGETADVVAIKRSGDTLKVDMFHCKYSSEASPSARVADLYAVCGQTQKAIRWRERPDRLLERLKNREDESRQRRGVSRLEKGSVQDLISWLNRWDEFDYQYEMTVVQPGYSKAEALKRREKGQFELLAATQSLLMDTWAIPFTFHCSA